MKQWRYITVLAAAVPLALAMSVSVQAQSADGYLNDDVTLRAGPAPEYPDIEGLPYGTYVSVQGCTEDWQWCDVIAEQGDRGWVPGDYIDYVYEGEPEVVTEYGPRIGIPIVTFSITNYWNEHYHDRPFYRERSTWFHRDIPHRAPAPPHHAVAHRAPPPPPPGGWHHEGHASSHPQHHESMSHHENASTQPHHESAWHHENASDASHRENTPPRHENASPRRENTPRHENAPNSPPPAPENQPEHPHGDHHANVRTPPMGASQQHGNSHAPPHSHTVAHPQYPASGASHGKRPPEQQKHKKDDHDHGDDNGH